MVTVKVLHGKLFKGRIEFWCPSCKTRWAFIHSVPKECEDCKEKLPNFRHLLASPNVRLRFHHTNSTKLQLRIKHEEDGSVTCINKETGEEVDPYDFVEGD